LGKSLLLAFCEYKSLLLTSKMVGLLPLRRRGMGVHPYYVGFWGMQKGQQMGGKRTGSFQQIEANSSHS
jgi:hypothetical protein